MPSPAHGHGPEETGRSRQEAEESTPRRRHFTMTCCITTMRNINIPVSRKKNPRQPVTLNWVQKRSKWLSLITVHHLKVSPNFSLLILNRKPSSFGKGLIKGDFQRANLVFACSLVI